MKVTIDNSRCQGHGRCYDLAPAVFDEDDEGYGHEKNDGVVPVESEADARLAEANCPEHAVVLEKV